MAITDFGVSKIVNEFHPQASTIVGTPAYMAPEILTKRYSRFNEPYNPFQADVWSIGIILHELLSGERPPRKQILDQPSLPRLVEKNPDYEVLIKTYKRCTTLNPVDRPSSAELRNFMSHLMETSKSQLGHSFFKS